MVYKSIHLCVKIKTSKNKRKKKSSSSITKHNVLLSNINIRNTYIMKLELFVLEYLEYAQK